MGGEWSRRKRARAVVREVSPNFDQALSSYFGTHVPDPLAARSAHTDYVTALREHGVVVDVLPGLSEHPDCTFVEDTAVVVGDAVCGAGISALAANLAKVINADVDGLVGD